MTNPIIEDLSDEEQTMYGVLMDGYLINLEINDSPLSSEAFALMHCDNQQVIERFREEQRVIMLICRFSEEIMTEEGGSMEPYLACCHNERMRRRFVELAKINQLLHLSAKIGKG